jgi:hypothetical protein
MARAWFDVSMLPNNKHCHPSKISTQYCLVLVLPRYLKARESSRLAACIVDLKLGQKCGPTKCYQLTSVALIAVDDTIQPVTCLVYCFPINDSSAADEPKRTNQRGISYKKHNSADNVPKCNLHPDPSVGGSCICS